MKTLKYVKAAVLAVALTSPMAGMAQETRVDVHVGANLTGFVGGDKYQVQDKKVKGGSIAGVGLSYETQNKIVLSSGVDLQMMAGKYSVMSDYLYDGKLPYTYPEVNSREIAIEIPVKIGYDFCLGKKLNLIPSVGIYGRYSVASIKENVTENFVGDKPNTFKWNSFENHANGKNHLDAYKRWDMGALVEAKLVYCKHYSMTLGYSRGFVYKSSQFHIKNHSLNFTIGYTF